MICLLNGTHSSALSLNRQLHDLAVGTPCHCQRRSQCTTGMPGTGTEGFHGFVVSVAIVQNLQMQMHSPSEAQLTERAESFCRALEGRWALGDCGNSVIVFVWEHYKKMIIWPARLAEKYVTVEERKNILHKVRDFFHFLDYLSVLKPSNFQVNDLAQTDQWYTALSQVIGELRKELNGEEEGKVDTGTLSLLVAVGLAVFLTMLITCGLSFYRFSKIFSFQ
ncbi:unnamed protein product [Nippostrongylus brasiliensis]|uniref:DCN1-like protein n=1 Tax=Nippostrongylus brasiliensis TaxID=27835 RepID=A0A0N4Y311_NIPBR|nr:unnamed protein product [Nippostrongylus brasiliensis]